MITTAKPRARDLGLVNRITPPDQLHAETLALAQTLATKLPTAVTIGKRAFAAQSAIPLSEAYDIAGAAMVANLMSPETDEGLSAFLAKRRPKWV